MAAYVSPFQGWPDLARSIWEIEPPGAYAQFVEALAGDRFSDYANWLRSLLPDEYRRFQGFLATNPGLKWTDYLDAIAPGMEGRFRAAVPLRTRAGQQRNKYDWW